MDNKVTIDGVEVKKGDFIIFKRNKFFNKNEEILGLISNAWVDKNNIICIETYSTVETSNMLNLYSENFINTYTGVKLVRFASIIERRFFAQYYKENYNKEWDSLNYRFIECNNPPKEDNSNILSKLIDKLPTYIFIMSKDKNGNLLKRKGVFSIDTDQKAVGYRSISTYEFIYSIDYSVSSLGNSLEILFNWVNCK